MIKAEWTNNDALSAKQTTQTRLLCAYLKEKDTGDVIVDVTAAVVNPIKEFVVNGENDAEIY